MPFTTMEHPTFIDDKLVSEPPCIEDFPVPSLMTPEGTRLWQRTKWGQETGPGPVGPVGHPVGIPGCRFVYNSHGLSLFAYHKTHGWFIHPRYSYSVKHH